MFWDFEVNEIKVFWMYCIKYVMWYLEKNYFDFSMILIIVIDFVNIIMYEFLSCFIG